MSGFTYQTITCPSCAQTASYQVVLPVGATLSVSCRYCHKTIKIKTNMQAQIERITKDGGNNMKVCPQCGKELKDEAKFCGSCGYKFPVAEAPVQTSGENNVCPACGNPLKPGAKFCGKCGAKLGNQTSEAEKDISKQASFIQWNILPGQLALKIDSKEIASYGRVKGIVIQEGLKALFFVNGKITAQLEAGSYEFREFPDVKISDGKNEEEKKKGLISTFFNNVRNFFRSGPALPQNVQNVTVVLVRAVEFPLVFSIKDVATSGIRSEVGLHLLCKISNINEFYAKVLLDKNYASFEELRNNLEPLVKNILNTTLSSTTPDKIASAQLSVLSALQAQVPQIYSYIQITNILNLTADNAELENIRRMQEELYVSELELTELTKRNAFLNRLHDENNAQALAEARSQTDFQAAMDKIDQDRELNEDERLKFSQMLEAQRLIREAKTEDEVENAIQVFKKSGLLREEEIDNIRAQIEQNTALRDLSYEQSLALATLANEKELDRQRLEWEKEIGTARIENELNQQRMRAAFDDERRRAEMQMDKEEQLTQLELLKQAQEIRQQKEQAEHQRQMEANAQKMTHEEEMRRMFQNMTAEQIVAANPDITPEAAAAMAEKFKSEAAIAQNDKTAQMAMQQSQQMQEFMQQQMQMMRDMAVAGMGTNAQNLAQRLSDKDAEINRFTNGVNNTVNAVSGALRNPQTVYQPTPATPAAPASANAQGTKAAHVCPSCGTPHEEGALFCENCGASL